MGAVIFDKLRTERPTPQQIRFFKSTAKHTAFGGARGGGKSWAGRRKLVLLCMRYDGLRCLLLRRTMPELRENHILPLQQELAGYARYKADEKAFVLPNGSRLVCGYCDNESDCMQYQGQEYEVILFEEATNFREEWITFIRTCLRTTRADFSPRCYYTMNPGGVSHNYFKRLFIDRRFEPDEDPDDYVYIPAKVSDNPYINDDYIHMLEALDPVKRAMHLEGRWDVFAGQFFETFRETPDPARAAEEGATLEQLRSERRWTHVIDPFEIPQGWAMYRSFDFGYAKPFSCAWWAIDYDGRAYRILELYGCTRTPNEGVKWMPDKIFGEIHRLEQEHPQLSGREIIGVADPSIWDASRGESVYDTACRNQVYFTPGDNKRIPGWMQCQYRLQFDDDGYPMMYVFANCKAFIRTIPLLQYDDHRPEDLDTTAEDHVADEWRYFCMARPITPQRAKAKKDAPGDDPLGLFDDGFDYIRRPRMERLG